MPAGFLPNKMPWGVTLIDPRFATTAFSASALSFSASPRPCEHYLPPDAP